MDPGVVDSHFNAITSKFFKKPIYVQEVGYPTSHECNSSEAKQAQFICNVFGAWDVYKGNMELVNFVRLNDLSRSGAEEVAGPYGIADNKFIEYLRTLGVRTYEGGGMDKEWFFILEEQANMRGWVSD